MSFDLPLNNMTTEEKLSVMEEIRGNLCHNPEEVPSPAWHAPILSEREHRVWEGQERITDWELAKKRVRESRS